MNNSFLKKLVLDWHKARKNATLVKSLSQSENAFRFKATSNLAPASDVFLHCYLALNNGKLQCLLITNKNDTQKQHNQQGGLTVVTTTAKLITSVLPIASDHFRRRNRGHGRVRCDRLTNVCSGGCGNLVGGCRDVSLVCVTPENEGKRTESTFELSKSRGFRQFW